MCGFGGYWSPGQEVTRDDEILAGMGQAIAHRGPDSQGSWKGQGVALVHRRLSIQDLSACGAQPMESASGRFVLAFNGEIYNFTSIRERLIPLGFSFRGHSDTEVMLASFEAWGVREALEVFAGMFAFALVDRAEHRLYLCRDRFGEKPLYYGWQKGTLLFGSELKALRQHPVWQGNVNRTALPLLVRHNFIPAPHCIYEGIQKLMPASLVSFDLDDPQIGVLPSPERYWDLEACFEPGPFNNRKTAADHLETLLGDVIEEQMVSDVPLGAFLSGGIDSSTVVALMQKRSSRSVKTFSIGFDEPGYNEAIHAKGVAEHLGTDHTEVYLSPADALSLVPELPTMYDEPFADSSQLPTHLVSRVTREHVTVALSGDGGDELFCGYTRYPATVRQWERRHSPRALARRGAALLPSEPVARLARRFAPRQQDRSVGALSERLRREQLKSSSRTISELYRSSVSVWADPSRVALEAQEPDYALTAPVPESIENDPLKVLMWRDLNWYLPDDILTKVDRAAMACSLETRIPLLDHRVVRFALGLPTSVNMNGSQGKQVLREVLYRHVPRELVDRPKQGFAVPLGAWLRTSLRDWAEVLLEPRALAQQGHWDVGVVRWYWEEHLQGREDYSFELWGILMFQAWLQQS